MPEGRDPTDPTRMSPGHRARFAAPDGPLLGPSRVRHAVPKIDKGKRLNDEDAAISKCYLFPTETITNLRHGSDTPFFDGKSASR